MELKQIHLFRETYECRSMSKAAQALYISQQALSKQIIALEAELGAPLFERTSKGLIPTKYGDLLYRESEPLMAARAAIMSAFEAMKQAECETLRLCVEKGLLRSNEGNVWSTVVQTCREEGDFDLNVVDLDGDNCRKAVSDGTCDAALVVSNSYEAIPGLSWIDLGPIDIYLAVKKTHPLAQKPSIDPQAVASLRLPIPNEVTLAWTEQALRDYGCTEMPHFLWHDRNILNLDAQILVYADAVVCWRSLFPSETQRQLRYYRIGTIDLRLLFAMGRVERARLDLLADAFRAQLRHI